MATISRADTTIPVLDGLRGVAILLVMAYHFGPLISWGWMGVDLFFVLSGFLITKSLCSFPINGANLLIFFKNRFLRIAPAYYLVIAVFFMLVPQVYSLAEGAAFKELQQNQWVFWLYQVDVWYAFFGWPEMIYLVPFWSLSVEFKFYLLWPLVLYLIQHLKSRNRELILLAIIAIAVLFRVSGDHFMNFASDFRYVFFLSRLDSFAIGALLYMKYQQRQQAGKYGTIVLAAIVIFLVICFLGFDWDGAFSHPFIHMVGFTFIAAGWAILVGRVLMKPTGFYHFFSSTPLRTIGKYSYSIYLIHYPVWLLVIKLDFAVPISALISFVVSIFLGGMSYHLVEKPFLRMKKLPVHA